MKKSIFLLLVLAAFVMGHTRLQAQSENEFKIGYGYLSGTDVAVTVASAFGTTAGSILGLAVGDAVSIIVNGQATDVTITQITQDEMLWGTFYAGYNRYITKRWSAGVQLNYNPIRIVDKVYYSNGSNREYDNQYAFLSFYARTDINYVREDKFQLYSGFMLGGITELGDASGDAIVAVHLTALGFRYGRGHAITGELGLGFGPLVSFGYCGRF